MDPCTNHLISAEEYAKNKEFLSDLYEEVPGHLAKAAELELAGRKETYVGKESTGSINTWAAKKRAKRKAMKKARKLCCR